MARVERQGTSELSYAETADLQVVERPYRGGCRLTVILPKARRSLTQIIGHLGQSGRLQALMSQAYPQLVRLALPRIDIDSGVVSMTGPYGRSAWSRCSDRTPI
jgi:hypothetical protein